MGEMEKMDVMNARKEGKIAKGEKIKGGCVCLAPGKSVGAHTTGNGEEVIMVLEGEALVEANGESRKIGKDDCVFIPKETVHDVKNPSDKNLVYVYFVGGK